MALVLPDVVRELHLTPEQQRQIQEIIDAADALMPQIDSEARLRGEGRDQIAQRRDALLDESRRKALQLLTDEQRELLAEILR